MRNHPYLPINSARNRTRTSAGSIRPLTAMPSFHCCALDTFGSRRGESFSGRYALEACEVVILHHGPSPFQPSSLRISLPVSSKSLSRGIVLTISTFSSVLSEQPLIPIYNPISTFHQSFPSDDPSVHIPALWPRLSSR